MRVAGDPTLLYVVIAFFAAERAFEVAINHRNSRILRERGASWYGPRDGFAGILGAQILLFAGTLFEGSSAAWGGVQPWTWWCIVALALAQALRYWCIATLGWRWSIRLVTVPGAARIASGPYRWFAHPNYAVVLAEAILLPLAFAAYVTLLLVVPLQLVALRHRIRLEERALGATMSRRAGE